jgi:hypothetical protein
VYRGDRPRPLDMGWIGDQGVEPRHENVPHQPAPLHHRARHAAGDSGRTLPLLVSDTEQTRGTREAHQGMATSRDKARSNRPGNDLGPRGRPRPELRSEPRSTDTQEQDVSVPRCGAVLQETSSFRSVKLPGLDDSASCRRHRRRLPRTAGPALPHPGPPRRAIDNRGRGSRQTDPFDPDGLGHRYPDLPPP